MMRLSTMWNVDRTVGTEGRSPIADQIAEAWPHEPGSVRFFRSSANVLYVFAHAGQWQFLRFADSSERERDSIAAEMELLTWLASKGIAVASPVPSRYGRFVETVETELGTFHAVVFRALPGAQPESDELDEAGFRAWGAALGSLHAALAAYPAAAACSRPTLQHRLTDARRYLPADFAEAARALDELEAILAALPRDTRVYGLIHGDFELDNLVWDAGAIQMLDFDDCAQGWFAADIAFALRDRFDAGADPGEADIRAFLAGYAAQMPLTEEQVGQLPLFSRVARLLQLARIIRALDIEKAPEQPDWLNALIEKLENRRDTLLVGLTTESDEA